MKKINIIIVIGLMLCASVIAGVSLNARSNSRIEINKTQQDILEARNLINPNISKMVCDGTNCRRCAKAGDYGMGCVKFAQRYCSRYSEPDELGDEICLEYTNYTDLELESKEAQAYKTRWEDIADVIVEREQRDLEVKFDEEQVTIDESK